MSDVNVTILQNEFRIFVDNTVKFLINPTRFYAEAKIIMYRDIMRHFQNEQEESGTKWAPLKYQRGRGARARVKILQDTGRLRESIEAYSTNKGAETGTNLIYAATHNFGDESRNIPQREFMWLSSDAKESILNRIMFHLANERGIA